MKYQLTALEARVIGCLLEKQVTTPEQYPLSVNGVVTACNQKTNREPVMNLSESEVQEQLDNLVKRHYLRTVSGFGNRVTKYEQRFCNSEFGDLKLSAAEVALITTLLLRGAQTPGELRSRAARMYEFSDMAEVESTLEQLVNREDGPFVVRLAREPGKRENRYMHLFSGEVEDQPAVTDMSNAVDGDLQARVEALEIEVAELKQRLDSLLAAASDWTLQGAWSPTRAKALPICESWRIPYADSLSSLAASCDAVFVHSSTASHFDVVSTLLNAGVHVCVDKPLAENLRDAERLVELAARKKLTLMVGFNRRFAPLYGELKTQLATAASLRMDKHRSNSVGPHDLYFTLLDDYLHVVDTALWLSGGKASLDGGTLLTNDAGEMLFAEHHFSAGPLQITTCMHRRAGSQRETVQAVTDGALIDITDMREWREERGQGVVHKPIPGWQSTLEQRGFVGCARHFIECVQNQTVPQTAGEQAVLAQRIVDKIWRDAMSE